MRMGYPRNANQDDWWNSFAKRMDLNANFLLQDVIEKISKDPILKEKMSTLTKLWIFMKIERIPQEVHSFINKS